VREPLDLVVPAAESLRAWLPEIVLVVTFLVAMPLSLASRGRLTWLPRGVTAMGLFVAAAAAATGLGDTAALGNDFHLAATAALVRLVVCAAALVVVLLGALSWRTPPGAREVPIRVHPFVALHALALCLLPQAHNLTGAAVAVMSATLGATLLIGLCARTARARAAVLRASLAAAAGAAFAVYGLSLRYSLAGTSAFTAPDAITPAWAVTNLVMLGGLLVAFTALPALWSPGRGDAEGGVPGTLTGFLAGLPMFAVATLVWRLTPAGLPTSWVNALMGLAAVLLAVGAFGVFGSRPPATRFAWLSLSQAGYLLLASAAPPDVGLAPFLRHLALVALGGLAAFGLAHLGGQQRRALTRVISGLFLVGLAGLPLLLILALWSAGRPALVAVAALGLLGSVGYLRLAFVRWGLRVVDHEKEYGG
jgi:NADH:ubiquinone oxidoreductase subunit 2 (subunit N)